MSQPVCSTTPEPTAPVQADLPPWVDASTTAPDETESLRRELGTARAELSVAQRRINEQDREHAEFKIRVAAVAMSYARRHDWCSVVTEALDELGLEVPPVPVSGTISVTYSFSAGVDPRQINRLNSGWIRGSLMVSLDDGLELDDDFTDAVFEVEGVSIDDYHVAED